MATSSKPKKRFLYDDDQETKNARPEDSTDAEEEQDVFTSSPIHDRQSTFVAHFHPASRLFRSSTAATSTSTSNGSKLQEKAVPLTATIKKLQSHAAFLDADHRMVAWRKRSAQRTLLGTTSTTTTTTTTAGPALYTTGSEDDGEKYGGKRLERVLSDMDVEGAVVVARWYGGVLLGPVRFSHIENCAREAIQKWKKGRALGVGERVGMTKRRRLGSDDDDDDSSVTGRGEGRGATTDSKAGVAAAATAAAEEAAEKARLANQLAERDANIVALRGLLANMKTKSRGGGGGGAAAGAATGTATTTTNEESSPSQQSSATASSPAKKMEYSALPLATLRQLDKARDATIAFILKQLDKLEEEEEGGARG